MNGEAITGHLDVLHASELPPSIDVVVDFYEHPANSDAIQSIRVSVPVMQSSRDSQGYVRPGYVRDVTYRVLVALGIASEDPVVGSVTGPLADLMAAGAHGEVRSGPECKIHAGCQAEERV